MSEFLNYINDFINNSIMVIGIWGIIINCVLIVVEAIFPVLPLSLFVTIIFLRCGNFLGFIISWIFAVVGCSLSFYLFQTVFQKKVERKFREKPKFDKFMTIIDNIRFTTLVLLMSVPFTPTSLLNIAAGVSKIKFKKYLAALLISKLFLIYFLGYVGVSLVESINNPIILVKVAIMLAIAYIISIILNKKLNL